MSYQPLTDARQSGTIAALKLGVAVGAGLGFVVYLISGTDATSNLFSASAVKAVQAAPVTQVANIHGQPVYQTGSATTSFSAGTPAASVRLGAYETGSNVIVGSAPMTSQAPIALSMLVVGAIAGVAVRLFKKRSEPLSTLAPLAMAATTGVREPSRRDVLAGTVMATLAAQAPSPALAAPKTAAELAIQDLRTKVGKVIAAKVLSGEVDISVTDVLRLAVHDALTYDPETKRGCFNGSIRFPEELKRPENAGLAPAVEKLLALQKAIKAEVGRDISFADISAITGLFIISESFKAALCSKTAADACGTAVPFNKPPKPVGLGRIDAESPDPEGQIPWTGSSVEDFKAAGKKIGIVSKELMALLPALLDDEAKAVELFMQDGQCAGIIKSLEQSKTTQTRTTYEIALYAAYLKLVNFARFSSAQYYP